MHLHSSPSNMGFAASPCFLVLLVMSLRNFFRVVVFQFALRNFLLSRVRGARFKLVVALSLCVRYIFSYILYASFPRDCSHVCRLCVLRLHVFVIVLFPLSVSIVVVALLVSRCRVCWSLASEVSVPIDVVRVKSNVNSLSDFGYALVRVS